VVKGLADALENDGAHSKQVYAVRAIERCGA
jgi:hypothetical protein